jgi:regulator of sigma E protease
MSPSKWEDVLNTVKTYSGEGSLAIEINRKGESKTFQIVPKMTAQMNSQGGEEKRYTIGIIPHILLAAPIMTKVKADGVLSALSRGVQKTSEVTVMTVLSFLRLIQNKISPKNIGGVISIGQAASETFKIGFTHFLQMMAVISINLFILNLLPIPVLDGGHLLFYTIEALKGAPVSMKKMEIAQQIGLVVLMSLMVFALFNDFSRLLGVW